MTALDFDAIAIGQELPPLELPAISRTTLALFAGASGDHNPIHIDLDFARQAGVADVFAQGMLSMAYLGRLLTHWVAQRQIRNFNARFLGIVQLGNILTCRGKVVEKYRQDGACLIKVELLGVTQFGENKILGDALIAC